VRPTPTLTLSRRRTSGRCSSALGQRPDRRRLSLGDAEVRCRTGGARHRWGRLSLQVIDPEKARVIRQTRRASPLQTRLSPALQDCSTRCPVNNRRERPGLPRGPDPNPRRATDPFVHAPHQGQDQDTDVALDDLTTQDWTGRGANLPRAHVTEELRLLARGVLSLSP
jgi:hypothetical protein